MKLINISDEALVSVAKLPLDHYADTQGSEGGNLNGEQAEPEFVIATIKPGELREFDLRTIVADSVTLNCRAILASVSPRMDPKRNASATTTTRFLHHQAASTNRSIAWRTCKCFKAARRYWVRIVRQRLKICKRIGPRRGGTVSA